MPVTSSFACDALVVGAGITGALVAERLTRMGREVVVIDREQPSLGSTIASTAMLLWEIDRPLCELTQLYDFERAARGYRASRYAVQGLLELIGRQRIRCAMWPRSSLYLSAEDDPGLVKAEAALRSRINLPSHFLDHRALAKRFSMIRAGAVLSEGAAEADPVELTRGLLDISLARGARLMKGDAVAFDNAGSTVNVGLGNGSQIEAHHVVPATGYVMPDIVRPSAQQAASS